jgi:hypothetical protein
MLLADKPYSKQNVRFRFLLTFVRDMFRVDKHLASNARHERRNARSYLCKTELVRVDKMLVKHPNLKFNSKNVQ